MLVNGAQAQRTLLALAPTPDASRVARSALHDLGLPQDIDHTVTLLTSEIVANSVRHADMAPGEAIMFCAWVSGDQARVEVADTGPGFDPRVRHTADGYGLRMLDRLASRWDVERTAQGSRVWFEVDRSSGRFSRTA